MTPLQDPGADGLARFGVALWNNLPIALPIKKLEVGLSSSVILPIILPCGVSGKPGFAYSFPVRKLGLEPFQPSSAFGSAHQTFAAGQFSDETLSIAVPTALTAAQSVLPQISAYCLAFNWSSAHPLVHVGPACCLCLQSRQAFWSIRHSVPATSSRTGQLPFDLLQL